MKLISKCQFGTKLLLGPMYTPEQLKTIASYLPISGTIMDINEAYKNPTAKNIGIATFSGLTDILGGKLYSSIGKLTGKKLLQKVLTKEGNNISFGTMKRGTLTSALGSILGLEGANAGINYMQNKKSNTIPEITLPTVTITAKAKTNNIKPFKNNRQ